MSRPLNVGKIAFAGIGIVALTYVSLFRRKTVTTYNPHSLAGLMLSEIEYKGFMKHGVCTELNWESQEIKFTPYHHNKRVGVETKINRMTRTETTYVNDKKHGLTSSYKIPNGGPVWYKMPLPLRTPEHDLSETCDYVNDEKHGSEKTFNDFMPHPGTMRNYTHGKLGSLLSETEYRQGKKHGTSTTFSFSGSGKIDSVTSWENGNLKTEIRK